MYGIDATYPTAPPRADKDDPLTVGEGEFMEFRSGYYKPRFILYRDRSTDPGSWAAIGLDVSTVYLEDFIRYIREVEGEARKRKDYEVVPHCNNLWQQVAGAVSTWTKSTCNTEGLLDIKVKELQHQYGVKKR